MGEYLELKRQIFHAVFGIILVYLLYENLLNIQLMFALLLIGFGISFLSKKYKLVVISWMLKNFDRKDESILGYGVLTYLLGSIIAASLFRKEIALASIMVLALGDSFSHFGSFGKIKNPFNNKKFLEGTFFGVIAGTLGASLFVSWQVAFFGSLIAMMIEGIELSIFNGKIDDNLLIPVAAGVIMSLF
ncbi:hypothetical protein HYV89_00475 [Candidatus Woesearchaeota archaeon]|nr:hypothetical protein [Candidatus Woesearchaeota archaeon]